MKPHEARMILPGAGDIQDKLNFLLDPHDDDESLITMEDAEALLDWLVEFMSDGEDE